MARVTYAPSVAGVKRSVSAATRRRARRSPNPASEVLAPAHVSRGVLPGSPREHEPARLETPAPTPPTPRRARGEHHACPCSELHAGEHRVRAEHARARRLQHRATGADSRSSRPHSASSRTCAHETDHSSVGRWDAHHHHSLAPWLSRAELGSTSARAAMARVPNTAPERAPPPASADDLQGARLHAAAPRAQRGLLLAARASSVGTDSISPRASPSASPRLHVVDHLAPRAAADAHPGCRLYARFRDHACPRPDLQQFGVERVDPARSMEAAWQGRSSGCARGGRSVDAQLHPRRADAALRRRRRGSRRSRSALALRRRRTPRTAPGRAPAVLAGARRMNPSRT